MSLIRQHNVKYRRNDLWQKGRWSVTDPVFQHIFIRLLKMILKLFPACFLFKPAPNTG